MTQELNNITFIGSKEEFSLYIKETKINHLSFNDKSSLFHLLYIDKQLTLIHTHKHLKLTVNFSSYDILHRISEKTAKLPLIKAIEGKRKNNKESQPLNIIDATAGLGSDSFCIAARGHQVMAIERSPVIYSLLKDGLNRAALNPSLRDISQRITLIYGEANMIISKCKKPDIIYLDPMFPEKNKSAKVKKNMQILQTLLMDEINVINNDKLFTIANKAAKQKVIVKRPKQSPLLSTTPPSSQLIGKSNRFDIYAT